MTQDNPQLTDTQEVPAATAPQSLDALVQAGPDSMRMPPAPFQQVARQQPSDDWEDRYNGLNRRYKEDRQAWDTQFSAVTQKLQALEARIAPPAQAQPQAPAASPDDKDDGLFQRVVELESERYRDNLLFQYMQPGNIGASLPLAMFRDNIPVVPPEVAGDGTVDDSKQRQAIEGFIKGLQGIAGGAAQQTQQQMIAGWTPGSSPGMPTYPRSRDELTAEYYKVMEEYGNLPADVTPEKEAAVKARYYQLHEEIGKDLPGKTQPWMTSDELLKRIQQLEGTMGQFGSMLKKR